jgi:hypothetical protein
MPSEGQLKEKPISVCTVCGRVGYHLHLINGKCGRRDADGKSCRGVNGSMLNNNDWAVCGRCAGAGGDSDSACVRCGGAGWLDVRPRVRGR